MIFRLRSAALVLTGLTAMMVAPAQAYELPEPLITDGSLSLPVPTNLQPIPASIELPDAVAADPLAPMPEDDLSVSQDRDQPQAETVRPTGDLAS